MAERSTEPQVLETVAGGLSPEQAIALVNLINKLAAEAVRQAVHRVARPLSSNKGYTPEVGALTRLIAAKSGDTLEGVMLKALTLYSLARDAVEQGDRLAILNPDDEIVRNIVGFETPDLAGEALAK